MADNLLQFDNLRAVLEEFAQEFKDTYRAELVANGRFTQYGKGRLVDSIDSSLNIVEAMIREGDQAWTVTINLNQYWKFVEEGTRPHWPPPDAILRWVQIKPVIPRPDARGRIPSPRSLAYLIGRKISRVGTEGSHDFKTAQASVLYVFRARVRRAMAADVRDYVRRVLAR
ncbi:MAG: hypothetical protein IJ654_05365 [Bacteroidales bacterium]|nr:hypothetical protein [Bacteroidales bacterium]